MLHENWQPLFLSTSLAKPTADLGTLLGVDQHQAITSRAGIGAASAVGVNSNERRGAGY